MELIYHYNFDLTLIDPIILLGSCTYRLACTLIGWERQNNSSDLLWSMPFKRSTPLYNKMVVWNL